MRAARHGKLVAVSSLVGQVPFPFESIYSATKFALEGLVLSLRLEVEPFGIRVALIQRRRSRPRSRRRSTSFLRRGRPIATWWRDSSTGTTC